MERERPAAVCCTHPFSHQYWHTIMDIHRELGVCLRAKQGRRSSIRICRSNIRRVLPIMSPNVIQIRNIQ